LITMYPYSPYFPVYLVSILYCSVTCTLSIIHQLKQCTITEEILIRPVNETSDMSGPVTRLLWQKRSRWPARYSVKKHIPNKLQRLPWKR